MASDIYPILKLAGGERYEIDTDKARLDRAVIHGFLAASHWAKDIPLALLERAIDHSIAFGLYRNGAQIGFARVVTDHATFAYLADVFVLPEERGRGLARWLIETILGDPELQGMRRWLLGTRDAQPLYRTCGFAEPPAPFTFLERYDPEIHAPRAVARRRARRALAEPRAAY